MVKHIILWTLKEMSEEEKTSVKMGIKTPRTRCRCRQ